MTLPFGLLALLSTAPCTPASGDARSVLSAAATATGLRSIESRALHVQGFDVVSQDFQSDRMYAPFLSTVDSFDTWFSPTTGVERTSSHSTVAGNSYGGATTLGGPTASYVVRDTGLVPSEQAHTSLYVTRPLNVWAVLDDWLASPAARVLERCDYRDYPRLVLSRTGPRGEERLFISEQSHIPIKLERTEPHYLWGQVRVEYVYSTWQRLDDAYVPGVSFRMVDGRTTIERVFGSMTLPPVDSAPALAVPSRAAPMRYPLTAFLEPSAPDTIRVSANVYLLKNPGYAETVMLARDTVFVLDATQGDARARQDSAWIAKLFPGRHPIVVVVTDLAWPHVAGVRYWVAQGATIVSHAAARSFLQSVVARRWTAAPDLLEQRRAGARLRFVAVSDSLRLAGGDLLLFAIDGRASEVALAAYSRPDAFLWASDYIQTLREPTAYLDDVWRAVNRVRIEPQRVAAEHLPLAAWDTVTRLAQRRPKAN
jgi:hypothetical protein